MNISNLIKTVFLSVLFVCGMQPLRRDKVLIGCHRDDEIVSTAI